MPKNDALIEYLRSRRSVRVKHLTAPAPSEEEVKTIIEIASRVPDHGKQVPWRIKLLREEGQAALGKFCADIFMKENPEAEEKHYAHEAARFQRAPLVFAVLYTPQFGKIPPWEQELTVGAVCMNLLHAVHGLGYAGQWLTEWPAFHSKVSHHLGCGTDSRIAGFIYVGTPTEVPEDRARPALDDVFEEWTGA